MCQAEHTGKAGAEEDVKQEGVQGGDRRAAGATRTKMLLGKCRGRLGVRRRAGAGHEAGEVRVGRCTHSTNTVEYPQGAKHRGGLSATKGQRNKVRRSDTCLPH